MLQQPTCSQYPLPGPALQLAGRPVGLRVRASSLAALFTECPAVRRAGAGDKVRQKLDGLFESV